MSRIRIIFVTLITVAAVAVIPAAASARHGHHGGRTQVAGTVASFTNHVLTIRLAGGSTVSGTVTRRTEIQCESGSQTARAADHGGSSNDQGSGEHGSGNSGSGDQQGRHDQNEVNDQNEANENEANENPADDQNDANGTSPMACGTSALVTGKTVRRARLETRHGVVTFKQINLGA